MIFFIHLLLSLALVGLVLHLWRRLPLQADESTAGRHREFLRWAAAGAGVPALVWIFLNLGLTSWLPPFRPEVDAAMNAGGSRFWVVLRYTGSGMTLIASFWAGISLAILAWMIRSRTENPAEFKETAILWSIFLVPACAVVVLIGGWSALGLAMVLWFAPIVHGTVDRTVIPKRAPSYGQAIGKLKFGKYSEAEMAILKELETCESDFKGWMMLAELYAVHFHDVQQAEETVLDLCAQPDIEPSNACVALHRLADWSLEINRDPDGARRCMEAISKRYPGTHLDRMARIRLNSLPKNTEELEDSRQNKAIHLPALHDDLDEPPFSGAVEQAELEALVEKFSKKLAADPGNAAAREEMARTLGRLEKWQAAIEQLDRLLSMPDATTDRRAEWMALRAVWLMEMQGDGPDVRRLLEQLIREFPKSPQAMGAQRRLFQLDERVRVAKYGRAKKKPRIVIRLDPPDDTL